MEYSIKNTMSFFISSIQFDMFLVWTESIGGKLSNIGCHPYTEIMFICEGSCCFEINNNVYDVKKGDYIIIPKNTPHRILKTSDNLRRITASPRFSKRNLSVENELLSDLKATKIHAITENMWNLMNIILSYSEKNDTKYHSAIENLVTALFFDLFFSLNISLMNEFEDRSGKKDKKELIVIMNYIRNNIPKIRTVSDIADHFNMSIRQLDRIIVKHKKLTAKQYLDGAKINYACHLLQFTNLPIHEISLKLGFSGLHSFDEFFKRMRKITPKEYRKISKNPEH